MGLGSWYLLSSTTRYELWKAERRDVEIEIGAARKSSGDSKALNLAHDYLCETHRIEDESRPKPWRQLDALFIHLYRAREQLIATYEIPALEARAQALLAEVNGDEIYTSLDRMAINQLLPREGGHYIPEDAEKAEKCRQNLQNAFWIRNQIQIASFFGFRITRHYQLILLTVGVPALLSSVALLALYSSRLSNAAWKSSWTPVVLSGLLGILGAVVSAAQRSSRMHPHTIADQLGAWIASLSRIPIGAVAGLTVWLFSLAAVQDDVSTLSTTNVFLAAFGAGFAERLIVQGVRTQGEDTALKK